MGKTYDGTRQNWLIHMYFKGFFEGQEGQITTLQKISEKTDGAKLNFVSSIFSDIFCKVAIWPTGPPEKALGVLSPA